MANPMILDDRIVVPATCRPSKSWNDAWKSIIRLSERFKWTALGMNQNSEGDSLIDNGYK